ncbi:MAG: Pyridoxamine 5'-phosphate oxidase [Candidatus Methanofastidiosum methylothiophilum]|uniref:Pyridoxamine 5'-phosphate oxidase n=1 Tax=Candidatus Methanofastidiosum methylothiophilum TaxID=1705564 RepID=A0A150J4C2_9EURY|nr:MAG: Pyridoxamine 5'-phosphate oxidase [Candidatus Methanofastidiosum methylthiophilus]NMC75851.1 pyridoxamine 5'-phosphate oxidase family protein [Candidatus Methanofastidiosa archaeon]
MEIVKIPKMKKSEYDKLISKQYLCRVAFRGDKYPYIAPLLYIFDGKHMYFLSTNYGKKISYFREYPYVLVEIEDYEKDFSDFSFMILSGKIIEITDEKEDKKIRKDFVEMLLTRNLSKNIMIALGHSPNESFEALINEKRSIVWKLIDVEEIKAFKK